MYVAIGRRFSNVANNCAIKCISFKQVHIIINARLLVSNVPASNKRLIVELISEGSSAKS